MERGLLAQLVARMDMQPTAVVLVERLLRQCAPDSS